MVLHRSRFPSDTFMLKENNFRFFIFCRNPKLGRRLFPCRSSTSSCVSEHRQEKSVVLGQFRIWRTFSVSATRESAEISWSFLLYSRFILPNLCSFLCRPEIRFRRMTNLDVSEQDLRKTRLQFYSALPLRQKAGIGRGVHQNEAVPVRR